MCARLRECLGVITRNLGSTWQPIPMLSLSLRRAALLTHRKKAKSTGKDEGRESDIALPNDRKDQLT